MSTRAIQALVAATACGSPTRNENCAHCDALSELEAIRKAARSYALVDEDRMYDHQCDTNHFHVTLLGIAKETP